MKASLEDQGCSTGWQSGSGRERPVAQDGMKTTGIEVEFSVRRFLQSEWQDF
jgi:hypothetical protein